MSLFKSDVVHVLVESLQQSELKIRYLQNLTPKIHLLYSKAGRLRGARPCCREDGTVLFIGGHMWVSSKELEFRLLRDYNHDVSCRANKRCSYAESTIHTMYTRRQSNDASMLGRRLRRCPNVEAPLGLGVVLLRIYLTKIMRSLKTRTIWVSNGLGSVDRVSADDPASVIYMTCYDPAAIAHSVGVWLLILRYGLGITVGSLLYMKLFL